MTPYYADDWLTIWQGDCRSVLAELPDESVHCVVTSPPYWGLRDYGVGGQLGLEPTPEEYVANMVGVFREVRRVLRNDGTLWLNLGDSYATGAGSVGDRPGGGKQGDAWNGHRGSRGGSSKQPHTGNAIGPATQPNRLPLPGLKAKDLVGIPWRVAFALQADGWYLRSDIIWAKPNPMPESVTDRPTKSHEYLFLLSRSPRYYYDAEAVKEPSIGTTAHLTGAGLLVPGQTPQGGNRQRYKMPDGWDTGAGGHGSYHRNGREKGAPPDKQRASAAASSAATERRMGGFNDRWDASEASGAAPLGRNLRTVWTIATQPYPGAHFATFPAKLAEPCIKAGCLEGGVVLDPFAGSGTTGMVAQSLSRRAVLIDLNGDYLLQAMKRNRDIPLGLDVA